MKRVKITDGLITVASAARQVLPDPPSPNSLWRWHAKGLNGVRLPTIKVGRTRYTTLSAFRQFLSEVGGTEEPPVVTDQKRTKSREAKLRREGLTD